MDYSVLHWAALAAICVFASIFAVNWYQSSVKSVYLPRKPQPDEEKSVFLFDGARLLSATACAESFLSDNTADPDWIRFHDGLKARFPALPAHPDDVDLSGKTIIAAADPLDAARLEIEPLDDILRVELIFEQAFSPDRNANPILQARLREELSQLRDVTDCAPYPIWKTDQTGSVIWQNTAYADLCKAALGEPHNDRQSLFADKLSDQQPGKTVRHAVQLRSEQDPRWYDLTVLEQNGAKTIYALDVSSVIKAETTQRNFVQTLAKTFAQLSTGLAIFDRNMQLVLFNPALIDLTELPVDFLSRRPNLLTFFDRLRDEHVMPEPKDYSSWRDQMSEMVAAAADGSYCETWTLPSGSTYRISGRPHPDGAVAFLIEDITAEVSLTRRFRSDLELSQSILDELEDAVAVFSSAGIMTVSNHAYRKMWKLEQDQVFADMTIIDASRCWQSVAGPNRLWGELRDFVLTRDSRTTWTAPLSLPDGQTLHCVIHPIQNGATMLRLTSVKPASPDLLRKPDWLDSAQLPVAGESR